MYRDTDSRAQAYLVRAKGAGYSDATHGRVDGEVIDALRSAAQRGARAHPRRTLGQSPTLYRRMFRTVPA